MRHAVCTLLLWLLTMASLMASPPVEVRDSILLLSPIDLKTTGETGDSLLWDFSQVSLGKHPSKLYLFADSLGGPSAIFSATHYQLSVHSDTLMLRGIEDKSLRITYSRSPVLLSAPLRYGSTQTGVLLGDGVYCDRLHLRFNGHYTLRVDAQGQLITPDGDTLRSVRVHLQNVYNAFLSPLNTPGNSLRQVRLTEDIYTWYPSDSFIPVIVVRTVSVDHRHTLINRAWYVHRGGPNRAIIPNNSEGPLRTQQSGDTIHRLHSPIDYQMSVGSGGRNVAVSYTLANNGHVEFVLSDASGIVYQHHYIDARGGAFTSQQINCQTMRPGQYVLYINVAGHRYAEKFLIE